MNNILLHNVFMNESQNCTFVLHENTVW